MSSYSSILVILATALALGGCAVSSGLDSVRSDVSSVPIETASLPALPGAAASVEVPSLETEKFFQSDQEALVVDTPDIQAEEIRSDIQQAYAKSGANQPVISTERASLKPFVGRWALATSHTQSKVQKIGSLLGISDRCELVLEDQSSEYGYKASGNSACPTSLFMLDSWVAFENRLVLRDHMGDEIVKLSSRDNHTWVGVNKDGNTLILNKS